MRSGDGEATFTTHIMVKYSKDKYKTKGAKYFAYAVYGMNIPISRTFKEYRKRFGIESSYKLMNQARARTSTKKTCPTTAICRIRPPTGQHLDLHTNGHVSAYHEEEAANHEPKPSKPC
jgi:hypothetical protein